jgi:hypothetical protein
LAARRNPFLQPTMNAAIVDTDVVAMLFKGDTRALAYRDVSFTDRLSGHPASGQTDPY